MIVNEDITKVLTKVSHGDRQAANRLWSLVYPELHGLAAAALRNERVSHTLQATALVHEVYVKLVGREGRPWRDRAHFCAVAAQAIRRILVDHARTRGRVKRGARWQKLHLHDAFLKANDSNLDMVALDEALNRLARDHSRKSLVVEMRFFGGMTTEETAEVLGVNARSVDRDWQFAKAWLFRELTNDSPHAQPPPVGNTHHVGPSRTTN